MYEGKWVCIWYINEGLGGGGCTLLNLIHNSLWWDDKFGIIIVLVMKPEQIFPFTQYATIYSDSWSSVLNWSGRLLFKQTRDDKCCRLWDSGDINSELSPQTTYKWRYWVIFLLRSSDALSYEVLESVTDASTGSLSYRSYLHVEIKNVSSRETVLP